MGNVKRFCEWVSDESCEFYYVTTENDRLEFQSIGSCENEVYFETAGYPKDMLTIRFINYEVVKVIVATESAFFNSKYEVISDVLDVEFVNERLIDIKTSRFAFSMFKED